MIEQLSFHRFKRFREASFDFRPSGVTLVAGGNNSGKTSILQGLGVWEFCKVVILQERGPDTLLAGHARQGIGMSDSDFSPINVPTLKHLWTNLSAQRDGEPDGYTAKIRATWRTSGASKFLEFGLSLANDRLFIKVTDSNLGAGDHIPRVAYLPPFSGMTDQEQRLPVAIRTRLVGQGLAGAVLRNVLLDMQVANAKERTRLKGTRDKIKNSDLRNLRATDPWERLQVALRETFSVAIEVEPFNELYHSYIRVLAYGGELSSGRFTKLPGYNKRDIMVEGSGFLQWLSVFAMAVNPEVDVLLLDEPDAHLHPTLQTDLVDRLREVTSQSGKLVLIATHSPDILKAAPHDEVFGLSRGRGLYLTSEDQKVAVLAGLGTEYAPRLNRLQRSPRMLIVENDTDAKVLEAWATALGRDWPAHVVVYPYSPGHTERKQLFIGLSADIADLRAVSLRDRDDGALAAVDATLREPGRPDTIPGLYYRTWPRRDIEAYLLWPAAIARAAGVPVEDVVRLLAEGHGLVVGNEYQRTDALSALMDARGKQILTVHPRSVRAEFGVTPLQIASAMQPGEVCEDVSTLLDQIDDLLPSL
jgi:predicted ATPase